MHQSASTVVERSQCKECGGASSASTVVSALGARSAVGVQICQSCEHGRRARKRSKCKECGGASICEHGRQRSKCKECGGAWNLRARSSAL